jgi:prepilin-type N-terminal cleavage/methylation domain-containing protein
MMKLPLDSTTPTQKGFTLIEMLVSLSVFTVVLMLSMSSIISVLDANQKSQTLRSAMDNLNVTLEAMSRKIRFGERYHCGTNTPLNVPRDCSSGDSSFTFLASDGTTITYTLSGRYITWSPNGGAASYLLNSPDMVIQKLTFYVTGSAAYANGTDLSQPRVVIVIQGYSGTKSSTRTSFFLETTISQRKLDS